MRDALRSELSALFGDALVAQANLTDPSTIHISSAQLEAIQTAADRLLALSGQPDAQRVYVSSLAPRVRLILCLWIGGADLVGMVTRAIQRQPTPPPDAQDPPWVM